MQEAQGQGTILGHPRGLAVLFFTEMWERFCYYGMRALLVLYLVDFYKWTQQDASTIYKWYTSLVYVTPLLGGYLADRYLGNKWAIVIGSVMMAVGEFMLAVPAIRFFYIGLGFLIIGNGFFKPNMSVQVGRLYPQNDPRRDGAYTIFYMGINLGAFIAPLVTGALRDTPGLGFQWGFAAAGVGMLFALAIYLLGLPWIKELPADAVYQKSAEEEKAAEESGHVEVMTEVEAERTPSIAPNFSAASPMLFSLVGVLLILAAIATYMFKLSTPDNAFAMVLAGASAFIGAWILKQLSMAVRDRVLAIYVLFAFVVFFWAAFEQAGNAMNVWADQTTNRYLTSTPPAPELYPSPPVDVAERGVAAAIWDALSRTFYINPVLTTSFQSINPFAIFILAPLFAWLWTFLAKKNINLSIAAKMAIGVFMQGLAFSLMIFAANYENQSSESKLPRLPYSIVQETDQLYFNDAPDLGNEAALERHQKGTPDPAKDRMLAHGGRMWFDAGSGTLKVRGVLDENHRDRMLRSTASREFVKEVWDLALKTHAAAQDASKRGEKGFTVQHTLSNVPPGFDARYLNAFRERDLKYDPATHTFTVTTELADRDYKQILVAGADASFREALNDLYVKSTAFRVSTWWLFWFYILCTLGELCLSPVGLSMVSKLAPRRFATMLMGMWLLTSFFGNFCAGLAGEHWESMQPLSYFGFITIVMFGASAVCFLLTKKITSMMHGVK